MWPSQTTPMWFGSWTGSPTARFFAGFACGKWPLAICNTQLLLHGSWVHGLLSQLYLGVMMVYQYVYILYHTCVSKNIGYLWIPHVSYNILVNLSGPHVWLWVSIWPHTSNLTKSQGTKSLRDWIFSSCWTILDGFSFCLEWHPCFDKVQHVRSVQTFLAIYYKSSKWSFRQFLGRISFLDLTIFCGGHQPEVWSLQLSQGKPYTSK